jgi:hypothetical protein
MQCMGLVMPLASIILIAGCSQKQESFFDAQRPLSGCHHIDGNKEDEISLDAKSFFLEEVGVKISSISVGRPSVCTDKTVVPIEAITEHTNVPRIWFVEIDVEDSARMNLIRPD